MPAAGGRSPRAGPVSRSLGLPRPQQVSDGAGHLRPLSVPRLTSGFSVTGRQCVRTACRTSHQRDTVRRGPLARRYERLDSIGNPDLGKARMKTMLTKLTRVLVAGIL